ADWGSIADISRFWLPGRTRIVEKRVKEARRPAPARKPAGKRKRTRAAPKSIDSSDEVAKLRRQLKHSLEQQDAISDILRLISSSPGNVKPVFDMVARHAARICEAQIVDI